MKKKKSSRKKKKKEEKEESIKPLTHENVGNINCFSEEIARDIINKLISLTFSRIYMKKMNKIIDEFYVINLFKTFNNLIEMNNINHDMDIDNQTDENNKNKSFIIELKKDKIQRRIQEKKIYNKNNNLKKAQSNEELPKTFMEEIDSNYLRNRVLLYDAEITNKNFWDTIPQPQSSSFERTSTYKNIIKIVNEKDFPKEIEKQPVNAKKKYFKLKSYFHKFIENKMEDYYKIKRKQYIKVREELPSEKIPNEILGIIEEEEDIKKMRRKLLEEIEKKDKEKKMEKERKRIEELLKKNQDKNKKNKDSEEKGLNPDSFIKEFISISSLQKEIKSGISISALEEEKKQLTKKAKKNIEYNKIPKIRPEKEQIRHDKLLQKIFMKKFKINKNKEDSNSEDSDESTGNIKPSGSNFYLIKPEVGVIIQENANVKSGGINFYEKYNKFSVNDFNKTMNIMFERNLSNNINNFDSSNMYTIGKIRSNSNFINNNTITTFNNNKKEKNNEASDNKKEDLNEKNLFRKTFMNRLTNLKKKFMYKSRSEICFSNNCNSDILREALTTGKNENSYYYYSNNLFNSNKSKNEFNTNFELSYIGTKKNKDINKKFFSPIPTNLLNTYKNTLLKNYFSDADKKDINQNQKINTLSEMNKKFNIMDIFNKNIVDGNNKKNDLLYQKIMHSTKNEFLPKIKYSESISVNRGTRTKNYFFRGRKKK